MTIVRFSVAPPFRTSCHVAGSRISDPGGAQAPLDGVENVAELGPGRDRFTLPAR